MLQFLTSWQVLMVLVALLLALALGIEPASPVLNVTDADWIWMLWGERR